MKRGSRSISSIYGFIMIFLLCMASIQTWSSAVGSLEELQGASDQSHQLEQIQGLEHLSLYLYDMAFTFPPSYGLGGALALILTIILLIVTVGYVRASVRQGALT